MTLAFLQLFKNFTAYLLIEIQLINIQDIKLSVLVALNIIAPLATIYHLLVLSTLVAIFFLIHTV